MSHMFHQFLHVWEGAAAANSGAVKGFSCRGKTTTMYECIKNKRNKLNETKSNIEEYGCNENMYETYKTRSENISSKQISNNELFYI